MTLRAQVTGLPADERRQVETGVGAGDDRAGGLVVGVHGDRGEAETLLPRARRRRPTSGSPRRGRRRRRRGPPCRSRTRSGEVGVGDRVDEGLHAAASGAAEQVDVGVDEGLGPVDRDGLDGEATGGPRRASAPAFASSAAATVASGKSVATVTDWLGLNGCPLGTAWRCDGRRGSCRPRSPRRERWLVTAVSKSGASRASTPAASRMASTVGAPASGDVDHLAGEALERRLPHRRGVLGPEGVERDDEGAAGRHGHVDRLGPAGRVLEHEQAGLVLADLVGRIATVDVSHGADALGRGCHVDAQGVGRREGEGAAHRARCDRAP